MRIPILDAQSKAVIMNYQGKNIKGIINTVNSYQTPTKVSGYIHDLKTLYPVYFSIPKDSLCEVLPEEEVNTLYKSIDKHALIKNMPVDSFTVGCDPEIFCVDGRGVIVPAFTFLPSKLERKGNQPFWDGFQAEFTTGCSTCLAYQVDEIQKGIHDVWKEMKVKNPKAKLTYKSVLDIPQSIMRKASGEHIQLGCAPSKSAYSGTEALNVLDPAGLPTRFAGFHMHFGKKFIDETDIINSVKMLDAITGVVSVSLLQGMEDERRRLFYGKAGEYRSPTWGLEYRTLGSGVLAHPVLVHLCFDLSRVAISLGKNYDFYKRAWVVTEEEVVKAINHYDIGLAKDILSRNKDMLKSIISRVYTPYKEAPIIVNHIFDLIWLGAKKYFDINKIEENWRLDSKWSTHSDSPKCSISSWSQSPKLIETKKKIAKVIGGQYV